MSDASPLLARFGEFVLDEANARLTRAGQPVDLQPKAFAVLCALARQPGRLVTKDALLDAVWGHRHTSDSVLKTIVSQLRAALADDPREPRFIETAARRGYRFIASLDGARAAPPAAEAIQTLDPSMQGWAGWVGRSAELRTLSEAFDAAAASQRQIVFVAGEAGIGKSSLIDRFVATVAPRRPAVGIGQCVEHYGAAEPYMPVLEALSMLCRDDSAALAHLRQVAPSWLAQLPWYHRDEDRERLAREVPGGATQDRMLREFGEMVDRWPAAGPLLIVLEDLHWCDHATVHLLAHLSRRRTPAALLVIASLRLVEVVAGRHPVADLRLEMRAHRLCREIDLEPLSEAEVGDWLASRLHRPEVPEPLVRALHAHTGGVPLFLAAVVDEQIDAGRLRPDDPVTPGPEAATLAVPRSIAGVIESQFTRLDAQTQGLIQTAATIGAEFDHLTIAAVLGREAETVRATLDAAALTGHWIRAGKAETLPDGRVAAHYRFRHALQSQVLYHRLGAAERVQRHRDVAEALVATRGDATGEVAAELAMHYERGGEPVQAAFQWATVGARALSRGAAREAMQAARQGQALIVARAGEATPAAALLELIVLEAVALTRTQVVSAPAVADTFERACAIAQTQRGGAARARAMHGRWWVHYARGELDEALRFAHTMLERAVADADAALERAGRSALGNTEAMMGRFGAARAELEAVIAAPPVPAGVFVQDLGVEARAQLALVLWWQGEPQAARRRAAEAIELAETVGHPVSQLVALNLAAAMHAHAGEYDLALPLNERIFEVIRHHGLPAGLGSFLWLHGMLLAKLGRVDEGLAEMHTAGASCETLGMRIGLSAYHLHLAEVNGELGRLDDAEDAIAQGLAWVETAQEAFVLSPLHRLQAGLCLARGDTEGFEASLLRAVAVARERAAPFQELAALVTAGRRPAGLHTAERDRLGELLVGYRDESSPWVARARALLA